MFLALNDLSKASIYRVRSWFLIFSMQVYINCLNGFLKESRVVRIGAGIRASEKSAEEPLLSVRSSRETSVS